MGSEGGAGSTAVLITWWTQLPVWAQLWLAWIACGIGLELVALVDRVEKNTLSRQIWSAVEVPFLHGVITTFLVWVTYHWIAERTMGLHVTWLDDLVVVAIGVLVSLLVQMARP